MCAFNLPDEWQHVKTTSERREAEGVGRDEPSVGPGAIDFAPKPEEHAIHDNDSEEEQLIFEDFVIQLQRGWTDGRTTHVRGERRRFSRCTPSLRIHHQEEGVPRIVVASNLRMS